MRRYLLGLNCNLETLIFPARRISTPLSMAPKNVTFPEDAVHVVTWFGAFQRNLRAKSLPLVHIHFRRLLPNGNLGPKVSIQSGVTALGQFRIGSIWEGNSSVSQFALQEREFDVDYGYGGWRSTSNAQHYADHGRPLLPQDRYELPYGEKDRSQILIFDAGRDGELLVPSTEFFARCYGRSGHVNRVLTTYSWDDVASRLYLPATQHIPGEWVVRLHPSVYKEDALLVAHAQYDKSVIHRLKRIYAQLAAANEDKARPFLFPEIGPWFSGEATLRVEGFEIAPGRFLALRILGGTEPNGPKVHPEFGTPAEVEQEEEDPEAERYGPRSPVINTPASEARRRELNDQVAPDGFASGLEFKDPSYTVLRPRSRVHVLRVERKEGQQKKATPSPPPEQVSPADADGGGAQKGVGRAGIRSPIRLDSAGALRDVWNALLFLKEKHPEIIAAVHWFTFDDRYVDEADPMLQALPVLEVSAELPGESVSRSNGEQRRRVQPEPGDDNDERAAARARWLYLDPKECTRPRGVLICRVTAVDGRAAYLFEVERRRRGSVISTEMDTADEGGVEEKEEPFRGLVISPSTSEPDDAWLLQVLHGIRFEMGKMRRAIRFCPPGIKNVYQRSSSTGDEIAGHSTVVNALDKVNISVPKPVPPSDDEGG